MIRETDHPTDVVDRDLQRSSTQLFQDRILKGQLMPVEAADAEAVWLQPVSFRLASHYLIAWKKSGECQSTDWKRAWDMFEETRRQPRRCAHPPTRDGRELALTRYRQPRAGPEALLGHLKLTLPAQPPAKITAAQAASATPRVVCRPSGGDSRKISALPPRYRATPRIREERSAVTALPGNSWLAPHAALPP
jgi:hypothetical protein